MNEISKTQIDKLGERFKKYPATEVDLFLLDKYRRSFRPAYDEVVLAIRKQIKLDPGGRPAKSTNSIVEKLKRESIRLTQIQDIAGCRIITSDIAEQNHIVTLLMKTFVGADLVDRRKHPSFGYRAVHIIVVIAEKPVEIQIRTKFQHIWAEISEKFADKLGNEIKYGKGNETILEFLKKLTTCIALYEKIDMMEKIPSSKTQLAKILEDVKVTLDNIGDKLK